MPIYYRMVGQLSLPKETDSFKPYREQKFQSGWVDRRLNFNLISGGSRFMNQVRGGHFENKDNDIFVFGKQKIVNGKTVSGQGFRIPFSQRLTSKKLDDVAEFKKFKIDLGDNQLRQNLKYALDKLNDGTSLTDDDWESINMSSDASKEDVKKAYDRQVKMKKEFISEWDYAEFINKALSSGKYKDKRFVVNGIFEGEYNADRGEWFASYKPNNIWLAKDDDVDSAEATVTILINQNSINSDYISDKEKYYVDGHVMQYSGTAKKMLPMPYTFSISASQNDKKEMAKAEKLISMLTVDDEEAVQEVGIVVELIDGAEIKEITFDDLDDEQKELIELGLIEFEDLQKELGGSMFGDKIRENKFKKFSKGYLRGMQDSAYTVQDLIINLSSDENVFEDNSDTIDDLDEDEDDDLFAD